MGSLIAGQEFQHILRLLNTNVDGRVKIMYALTAIKGIGRRFSNIVCKKAEVDMKKRAGSLVHYWAASHSQLEYGLTSGAIDSVMRDDLERLKKIRNHRGLRTYWGLRVRGQHTKTTGRAGKTMAAKKK
ncbi:ribosomal protein S18 [Haematococcus lacustris]|uniref:Ribosomal protein S18 n=1 Tax=Haematococcus lacustris TaxID=44745 RepID=A0A6A0A070_HAELA|nr:ribosomal protein S18 [Haematococcus lacustris]